MAAPLSGVGQQQIPLSQPFQPGGTDQTREIRQAEQEPREDELQVREAAPAQSQEANASEDSGVNLNQELRDALLENSQGAENGPQRGSNLNILV